MIDSEYIKKQPDISIKIRFIVVDWLFQVCQKFKMQHNTTIFGMEILDLYGSKEPIKRSEYQLIGCACLAVADFIVSVSACDLGDWAYISDNAFTVEKLIIQCKKVLRVLEFNVFGSLDCNFFSKKISDNTALAFVCTISDFDNLRYYPDKMELLLKCETLEDSSSEKPFDLKVLCKTSFLEKKLMGNTVVTKILNSLKPKEHNVLTNPPFPCKHEIASSYERLKELGHGTFSKVYACTDVNKNKFAMKVFEEENDLSWLGEVTLLPCLRHSPFIIQHHSVILDPASVILPLFDVSLKGFLKKKDVSSETIKHLVWMIAKGLKGLHEKRIIWKDLKPDNILISENPFSLVLSDFGISFFETDDMFNTCTYPYRPPEVFFRVPPSTTKIDIWGLGVLFYEMVTGNQLFDIVNVNDGLGLGLELMHSIGKCLDITWSNEVLPGCEETREFKKYTEILELSLSEEKEELKEELSEDDFSTTSCSRSIRTSEVKKLDLSDFDEKEKNLLLRMLTPDPVKRISAEQILSHPWFQDFTPPNTATQADSK